MAWGSAPLTPVLFKGQLHAVQSPLKMCNTGDVADIL